VAHVLHFLRADHEKFLFSGRDFYVTERGEKLNQAGEEKEKC
jgi:hypothetical protein